MKKLLTLAFAAICMASCSPYVLKSSSVLNDSDLSSYKSFQMQKIDDEKLPEEIMKPDVERIYYVIAQELKSRGYVQQDSGADLTVYLGLTTKDHIETDVDASTVGMNVGVGYGIAPRRWGRYRYLGPTPYTNAYFTTDATTTTEVVTEGVVVVDLVENEDNTHVFCAQLESKLSGDQIILKDNEKLADAVSTLFKKFPLPVQK